MTPLTLSQPALLEVAPGTQVERGCDFHVRRYFDELLSREELAA